MPGCETAYHPKGKTLTPHRHTPASRTTPNHLTTGRAGDRLHSNAPMAASPLAPKIMSRLCNASGTHVPRK
jgi:hypothetical protein